MVTQFLTRMQCANISAKDLQIDHWFAFLPLGMLQQSAENARLKHIQHEEELKRKLRERQAEALAALQKRSGYQMKEKRDKGLEFHSLSNRKFKRSYPDLFCTNSSTGEQ